MFKAAFIAALAGATLIRSQSPKQSQLAQALYNTEGQIETTDVGVEDDTEHSLKTGPRGYNLLEDTTARKKIIHFGHERVPERVVHALGHGAYGTFESYGDWSNMTSACWLQAGAKSDAFTRFSVVISSTGGSESGRDTHGFATKIYSSCGNHDLVGNHIPSFFINDGIDFPDLVHAVKFEPDKGFPTGGSAHTTAYDFFPQHPEGALQLMMALSDLGIPRDIRHVSGNGVHTYRFINAEGQTKLFKWYWKPMLGHRTVVYDEALKLAGKNNNFQKVDLYNNIAAGNFPEWEFQVQLFPDDGSYMWKGIDLLDATQVVPAEMNPPISLGKLTLNRNPTNFFAEPESISFAPSNAVKGVSFVPDPLLQWRLMSYDDTTTHRHNSPNGYLLPINRAVAPVNNNYRDGYMQPLIYEGASASSPDNIGGVVPASQNQTLPSTGMPPEQINGIIGRYNFSSEAYAQARIFYYTLDKYAQQHLVDSYIFEVGHATIPAVRQRYVDTVLNRIDNCLARRVAKGIGAQLPMVGSGPGNGTVTKVPSLYPATGAFEPDKDNTGLNIGILADEEHLSTADLNSIIPSLNSQKVFYEVVSSYIGDLSTGVFSNQSYITTSSTFYDAIIIGSSVQKSTNSTGTCSWLTNFNTQQFIQEAYGHGKALAILNGECVSTYRAMGIDVDAAMGVYTQGDIPSEVMDVLKALSGPVRFPQRMPVDDMSICS